MDFRISDTFTDSLAKLTGDEQKAAKTTAFDLQMNPANPGLKFHKLDQARDKNFWSVRVSRDIRLIVHKGAASLLLCYVNHHDAAYAWAERRRIERHPKTGAAQLVEIRETVREIEVPVYVEAAPATISPKSTLFENVPEDNLLDFGVPAEWLDDVRRATEDTLLDLADHLPGEAAEALLELATGGTPSQPVHVPSDFDPFEHPDAQRRFRVMTDVDELARALEYPWEKWTVFLHPAQREIVEGQYDGPARVAGSAGTGKTIVSLHRAAYLARKNTDAKILLTTFSLPLAKTLRQQLGRLIGDDADLRGRIAVRAIDEVGIELYEASFGTPKVLTPSMIQTLLHGASKQTQEHPFSVRFLEAEWADVVDVWQLTTWEEYRDVPRLGRKTRLSKEQRGLLWPIFERVRADLDERALVTMPVIFAALVEQLESGGERPFDFAVVDEAQDMSVAQLRFLWALAGDKPDGLFFSGDLGQRIFQTPFSWKLVGVDISDRSKKLRLNYRTSHQIRRQADQLLPADISDVDGNAEDRRGTVSAFNGPEPSIKVADSIDQEMQVIGDWISGLLEAGVLPEEIAVFVRSKEQFRRASKAIERSGVSAVTPVAGVGPKPGTVPVMTMHLAKGLEFRAVAVAACDDEIIPSQSRIEGVGDDADLEDVYNTERHLLYVACTRARDHLLVSGVEPASEFLDDLSRP